MDAIRILQLGPFDLQTRYAVADNCDWFYEPNITEKPKTFFDIAILTRSITEVERVYLFKNVQAYRLFYLEDVELDDATAWIVKSRKGKMLTWADVPRFLMEEPRFYFPNSYGEKMKPDAMAISDTFNGRIRWNGYTDVELEGDFGAEMSQIAYWRYNLPLEENVIEFWLEYEKSGSVEIALHITEFVPGSVSNISRIWEFDEDAMQSPMYVDSDVPGSLFLSLRARGEGVLKIMPLHDRFSRKGRGFFLPGGERIVTKEHQEAFFYFDPADMKPPLNIYFSGYKTQEGFEGYYMMRKYGTPFLLVSDARLEGGSFYMGTDEFEQSVLGKIRSCMDELGFTADQVNLSGLSMGTYGSLYYGCDLAPHAIILGKPLASLGTMAENEHINRPGGFPTSLDLVWSIGGGTDAKSIRRLDDRFWSKFDKTQWGRTKFVVSYMYEDDYDGTGYEKLLEHLVSAGVQVYGKGLHGRHNDNTPGIVGWFKDQYDKILRDDFGRDV